ncbi:MAG TPA: ribose 5-phosphate isomerase B [Bacteroidota bacterium]|nr:ribose 5-phosphate isomerase B [Bacteroidota bacterium]
MIAIASDHAGFAFKEKTKALLDALNIEYRDYGTRTPEACDYPDFAHQAAKAVSDGVCNEAIIVCGTGIGVSMVANKHKNVRAAMCTSEIAAELSRKHNNANVLCFGERLVTWETAEAMIQKFLTTPFEEGRHTPRVEKIHSLTGC